MLAHSMPSTSPAEIAREAQQLYDQRLKQVLESSNPDAFVAIEPVSGDYNLGRTLSEAVRACRTAHPDRLCHTVRVGHTAALHFGGC
jgi:hypothetical protein